MEIIQNNTILSFVFEKKIDYSISTHYEKSCNQDNQYHLQILELDFSNTTFVTLPGAIYVASMASRMITEKIVRELRIINYSDSVLKALVNFGFIRFLKSFANLQVESDVYALNEKIMHFWQEDVKHNEYNLRNLYWPMTRLPIKSSENEITTLYNKFINYFNLLFQNELIQAHATVDIELLRKRFIKCINEAIQNVWDHSESWGVAAIQSNNHSGTTLCVFDFGVGFINSFTKRKGTYIRNQKSDIQQLQWLFKKGNTTNEGQNFGHGLHIISQLINITNGTMLIRTDKYTMIYRDSNLKISEGKFCPGAQLMINF